MNSSKTVDTERKVAQENDVEQAGHGVLGVLDGNDGSSLGKGDILSREHTDPVLNAKMHLINNVSAICYQRRKHVSRRDSYTVDQGRLADLNIDNR